MKFADGLVKSIVRGSEPPPTPPAPTPPYQASVQRSRVIARGFPAAVKGPTVAIVNYDPPP